MELAIKLNCGNGTKQEQKEILRYILETGVLNANKDLALQKMPNTERYVFIIEDSIFDKIKNDEELYYGYQSNIAMAFVDEYHNYKKKKGKTLNNEDIHTIANNSAKNFLDVLIR